MSRVVLAAGTVCWRIVDDRVMVLLVHRTKQRDVSFPKGKLDKGESMPQAAMRETAEETGLSVALGVNLGTINYLMPNGDAKTVQYWAAKVTETAIQISTFRPNSEISALEWTPLTEVSARLTYPADRELFEVFTKLAAREAIDTFSVTLLRHAKAEPRNELWSEDHMRPLAEAGVRQAQVLVPVLAAFGPKRILSSSALRCQSTVEPLADFFNTEVRIKNSLSQDAWDLGETVALRRLIGKVVRNRRNTVLCTHAPVLPDAARELMLATGSLPGRYLEESTSLPPGGFSVFHFSHKHPGAGILAIETYPLKH